MILSTPKETGPTKSFLISFDVAIPCSGPLLFFASQPLRSAPLLAIEALPDFCAEFSFSVKYFRISDSAIRRGSLLRARGQAWAFPNQKAARTLRILRARFSAYFSVVREL